MKKYCVTVLYAYSLKYNKKPQAKLRNLLENLIHYIKKIPNRHHG